VVTNYELSKMYYKMYTICKNICILIATISTTLGFIASAFSQFCIVEELLSKVSAVRCGAENLVGMSKQQYVDRLTWVKQLMRFNLLNWHDRKNFERVSHVLETLKLDNSNGSIRRQPYCILLTGYPGCGKSNYALKLATACLKAKYGKAYSSDIVALNETDEFQSEFRTSHKVVIFDDLGAEKPGLSASNPWRKVIDFVNNIRKTSLNPNVEMKGNVYIEPDLVIITTNLANDLNTGFYCQAPSAIYRRLRKVLFLDKDFINARQVNIRRHTSDDVSTFTRVFDTTVCRWEFGASSPRTMIRNEVVEDFLLFDEQQKAFVNDTNSILDEVDNKNTLRCFYDDVVRPFMPVVCNFPISVEKQLPWYERVYRSLCQKEDMPICMSGSENDSSNLSSYLSDYESSFSDCCDSLVPQYGIERVAGYDEKLVDFLYRSINWKFYELVQHKFHSDDFEIYKGVIFDGSYDWCWDLKQRSSTASGIDCRKHHLDLAYNKFKATQKPCQDVDDISDEELKINLIWHYLYRTSKDVLTVKDNAKIVTWMNAELDKSSLGQLKVTDTMAMVQYFIAIRSRLRSFRCLGVEYSLYGFTPDVVLKSGSCTVVIECKNTKTTMGRKQLEKYLRSLQEDAVPSLGILFSQREVKFYALEPLPSGLIANARLLVFDVLQELKLRSIKLGTDHFSTIDRCGAVEPKDESK